MAFSAAPCSCLPSLLEYTLHSSILPPLSRTITTLPQHLLQVPSISTPYSRPTAISVSHTGPHHAQATHASTPASVPASHVFAMHPYGSSHPLTPMSKHVHPFGSCHPSTCTGCGTNCHTKAPFQQHLLTLASTFSSQFPFHLPHTHPPRHHTHPPLPWLTTPTRSATSAASPVKAEPNLSLTNPTLTITFPDDDGKALLTPSAVVSLLDKYIIGQDEAKRAVAIALRNRWRRHQIPGDMRDEIMPKNILMIGPTGCGKTEVARRLAKLADAPFIKVEATKYTELGFVGRDVDDIIKDLVENAILLTRQKLKARLQGHLDKAVEDRILAALCGASADEGTLRSFREKYREGVLDNIMVELDVLVRDPAAQPFTLGEGMLMFQEGFKKAMGAKKEKREMKVREARAHLEEAEAERVLPQEMITREAVKAAEDDGIVFIDEIDKIVDSQSRLFGGNVSSEGVQRDLLPIVEGCTVSTKYGNVSTDHILFICSGAFHSCKPSDMLAELQGRLPIRVELKGLSAQHFFRILTEPENNMVKQQQVLLATEGVDLSFTEDAVHAIARVAEEANRLLDNIGARRLHTVMERILADISYSAPEKVAEHGAMYKYVVDEEYVMQQMSGLLKKQDLSKYVL